MLVTLVFYIGPLLYSISAINRVEGNKMDGTSHLKYYIHRAAN